jgi:monoamine oxidase
VTEADVLIVGAGAAGLSAARELSAAGRRVLLLEGRNRIGGRILTHYTADYPVELGAEFVHGRPPEIFRIVQQAGLELAELEWNVLRGKEGRWYDTGEVMSGMDELFEKMSTDQPDQSFQEFLDQQDAEPEVKEQALGFVEGFHAADPSRIGVHSLVKNNAAEEEEDGGHQFRFAHGYETLVKSLSGHIHWKCCNLHLNTTIEEIQWKPGETLVKTSSGAEFRAPRSIITVPLGVLKSDGIRFSPRLAEKEKALQGLEMGPVIRASLCFRDKFWESEPRFKDVSFLFTDDPYFPTWWTSNPLPFPILTGWAAGHYARQLAKLSTDEVVQRAVGSLASIFAMDSENLRRELQAGFAHDWQSDPFSCGAYSYAVVGGSNAGRGLGAPIANTLFFAGEATDADGHNGTVHGAIASGKRAAKELLASDQRR